MADTLHTTSRFRFYGNLNDFLSPARKHKLFTLTVKGRPSIKDTLEALGVPHPEIDIIAVDGKSVGFDYRLKGKERVSIYPYPYGNKATVRKKGLVIMPPKPFRFVLDSHLGKLTRHLRLFGFDVTYKKYFPDPEIVDIGFKESRIVLTRDIGLLKNKNVRFGYWVRGCAPEKRLKEVLKRYGLRPQIRPFTRCLECNGKIKRIAKKTILSRLPPMVNQYYKRFYVCDKCEKIYWRGSHYEKLSKLIRRI